MATLEQIEARVKKLQEQADALIAKKAQAAVDQIRELMLKHGLTTEDIEGKAKAKRDAKAAAGTAGKVGAKAAGGSKVKVAKYQDPKTGATWTGHGRAPSWIANAKNRSKFLIQDGAEAAVPAGAAKASTTKTAVKKASSSVGATAVTGQPKGPQPAKYRDPKSGATWSGRGPAPAWLAAVKDRTRFLIEAASAVAPEANVVGKASKPNAAGKNGAITKEAAAKKVVAKKAPAAKKVVATKKATAKKAPATKDVAPASKKVVARKAAAPTAKKVAVKKAPAKKAVAKTVVATPDVVAAPASVTVQATA
jgi:DNA-binding protein H-NS